MTVFDRRELLDAIAQPGGDALAATAGLALEDTVLIGAVIAQGSSQTVQSVLRDIHGVFGDETALVLLEQALPRDDVASLALFQVAELDIKAADEAVWAALHDARLGGTAAAILARRTDRDTTRRLIELMKSTRAPLTRQRARLALSLSVDPYAQAEARNWVPAK